MIATESFTLIQGAVRVRPWNGGLALPEPNFIANQMNQSKSGRQQDEASALPLPLKQLLYRREVFDSKTRSLIRSKKTADLLQLHSDDAASNVHDAGPAVHSRPVQPGGFLRSRRTAALLGISLSGEVESSELKPD